MEELSKIETEFDNYKVYEYLDTFYLALQNQGEIDSFIKYVHKPIEVFEARVNDMKKLSIDPIF
jgi:hypothetical protein